MKKSTKSKVLNTALVVGLVCTNLVTTVPATSASVSGDVYSAIRRVTASKVLPTKATFDKMVPADIVASLNLDGNLFIGVKNGSKYLVQGTDYTVLGSEVTIKKEYLSTLTNGTKSLKFDVSTGSDPVLRVTIKDSSPSIKTTLANFSCKRQRDISVSMVLNGNALLGIKNGETPLVLGTDYRISGSRAYIKKEYLAKQPNGPTLLTFDFTAGNDPVLKVNVTDSTVQNLTVVSLANVEVTTTVGVKPQLPTIVNALMSDATSRNLAVNWDLIPASKYAVAGSFEVSGTVEGTTIKAKAIVTVIDVVVPPVTKAAVEGVQFVDYRHLRVSFSTIVDKASAEDASNYYFEIVDGDAGYAANNVIVKSLNFSEIGDGISGPELKVDGNIENKTVVDIYLPEDARFTNTLDLLRKSILDRDDERTIVVGQNNGSMLSPKALIKNVTVNVAVRNVRDKEGIRQIDTKVFPVRIFDQVKPELKSVTRVIGEFQGDEVERFSLGANNYTMTLTSDGSDYLQLGYNEPVFDTHGLGEAGFLNRDVMLYVDGKLVASQSGRDQNGKNIGRDLSDYMIFNMDAEDNYARSSQVDVNVKRAVEDVVGELYEAGKSHTIAIIGITDLAGNIGDAVNVKVNIVDPVNPTPPPVITLKPAVLDVKQISDNKFRVFFNRPDINQSTLDIDNADGEGGKLLAAIPAGFAYTPGPIINNVQSYWVDVAVRAVDTEHDNTNGFNDLVTDPDADVLAYDNQDFILRNVRVIDIDAGTGANFARGDNYTYGTMKIVKDILSPTISTHDTIQYNKAKRDAKIETKLVIGLQDLFPWAITDPKDRDVQAMTYYYDAQIDTFVTTNPSEYPDIEIANYTNGGVITPNHVTNDYLPVEVSYVDQNGAKHMAVIANVDLKNNKLPSGVNTSNITYQTGVDTLTLDLKNYKDLLDVNGNLVEGATYNLSIPKGYFSDKELTFSEASDSTIGVPSLDVANGRKPGSQGWYGVGFTTPKMTTNIDVQRKPADPTPIPDDAVPQTSKQLIHYDREKNEIWVEFTGQLNTSTDFANNPGSVRNPANYSYNNKTLKDWKADAVVEYVVKNNGTADLADDRQFAVFEVPCDTVAYDGDVPFTVENVTNKFGGKMTRVDTVVYLYDNTRPIVTNAVVSGTKQIVLTLNEPGLYLVDDAIRGDEISAARNFTVMAGNTPLTVLRAVIDTVNDRTITLDLSLIPEGPLTVTIGQDQNVNILIVDKNKNPLNKDNIISVVRPL